MALKNKTGRRTTEAAVSTQATSSTETATVTQSAPSAKAASSARNGVLLEGLVPPNIRMSRPLKRPACGAPGGSASRYAPELQNAIEIGA